jgi:hypothetical protein
MSGHVHMCIAIPPKHLLLWRHWRSELTSSTPLVRYPPQSGWLDGLGRLKGGWATGLGVARLMVLFPWATTNITRSITQNKRSFLLSILPLILLSF